MGPGPLNMISEWGGLCRWQETKQKSDDQQSANAEVKQEATVEDDDICSLGL